MKLRIKRTMSIMLCIMFTMCLSVPVAVSAREIPHGTAKCPRCKQVNTNYGCQENIRTRVLRADTGELCEGCNKIVPVGECHHYYAHFDLYYFLCNSNDCKGFSTPDRVYTEYFFNSYSDHSVKK